MKNTLERWLAAGCLAAVLLPGARAADDGGAAAGPPEVFRLRETVVGSMFKQDIVTAALPFDKRYAELTPAQKAIVRQDYEALADDDEPPYPELGMHHLVGSLVVLAMRLGHPGKLVASVDVDAQGHGQDVTVYASPAPEMSKAVASALAQESYKPASCKGQPCRMTYVLRLNFPAH